MLVSIIINNYNYEKYVVEAIESAINQTYKNVEIIIVDDGSTDKSINILEEIAKTDNRIKLFCKSNGGQLSAFNYGYKKSSGQIISFLDSDDLYNDDYIENIVEVYSQRFDCDFLYCGFEEFGQINRNVIQAFDSRINDLGYTAFLTYCSHAWIGERTSAISLRRCLANEIFPVPFEEDWRIRADDCVIWMASICGGRKFYLAEPLVKYRVHGENLHFGKKKHIDGKYKRKVGVARFFGNIGSVYPQFTHMPKEKLFRLLLLEATTGNKNEHILRDYFKCMAKFKRTGSIKHWKYLYKLNRDPVGFVKTLR